MMINPTDSQHKTIYVILFLLAGIIVFPSAFDSVSSIFSTSFRLFSIATLSSLAVSLLLFNYARAKSFVAVNKIFGTALLLFVAISFVQFIIFKRYSFGDFFFSIFWVSIPLFVCLFSRIFTRYLPVYLCFLWIVDLAVSFYESGEKVGIPGNRNWHASLLIVALLFSIYLIYLTIKHLRKLNSFTTNILVTLIYSISAILICYTGYLFYMCRSRGASLAALLALLIFICINFGSRLKRVKIKLFAFALVLVILVSLTLSLILIKIPYYDRGTQPATTMKSTYSDFSPKGILLALNEDVRIPLWEGAVKLIKDHPYIGTGTARFESVFAPYRPLAYFTKPDNAVRSNHPHNTLLYIAACFGLPGLILWCILWIYPMLYCFFRFSSLTSFMKITLLAYFCLFFHGLFDLVLFQWPTLYIAAILLGLLWKETCSTGVSPVKQCNTGVPPVKQCSTGVPPVKQCSTGVSPVKQCNTSVPAVNKDNAILVSKHKKISQSTSEPQAGRLSYNIPQVGRLCYIAFVTALLILGFTFYNVYINYRSSYFFRTGNYFAGIGKDERAVFQFQKGLALKKDPKYIYKAATLSITSLKTPELGLYFLNYFNKIPTYSYAHSNGFMALALLEMGKYKLTLPYLLKEVINYPLSAGAWYRLSLIQRYLGFNKASDVSLRNAERAVFYKGLPPNALKLLIENPKYDSHPNKIPQNILDKLNKESLTATDCRTKHTKKTNNNKIQLRALRVLRGTK